MTAELEAAYAQALPFDDHMARMRVHAAAFADHHARLAFVAEAHRRQAPFGTARVLVLTEDYCIDSLLNLPLVARLAEASPGAELRVASRDANAALAARFPGRGGVSRLPTVIFLGEPGETPRHWSERSAEDHAWMERFLAEDPMPEAMVEDGVPAPPFAAWMGRRLKAQGPVYRTRSWQAARDELLRACGSDRTRF